MMISCNSRRGINKAHNWHIYLSPGNVVKDFDLLKLQSEIDKVILPLELQDLSDVIAVFAAHALIK